MKLMQTHMKNELTNIEKCSDISDKKQSEETETCVSFVNEKKLR